MSSGKGGVGKTNISTNLAVALAQSGKRVCVFDADTSLANVNILLGIQPRFTLEQLLNSEASLDEVLVPAPGGIHIVPAASGIAELNSLDESRQAILLDALRTLERDFDYLLIDTAAGIGRNVLLFLQATRQTLLVVTPEPTSLTDAFALAKVLKQKKSDAELHVLVNMSSGYAESIDVYKRLAGACQRYLDMRPEYFGYIPRDDYLRMAVQAQKPVLIAWPQAAVSQRFVALARSMDQLLSHHQVPGRFSRFWERLAEHNAPLTRKRKPPAAIDVARSAAPVRKYPRSLMVKIHQGMTGLIRSRQLPSESMRKMMGSLLKLMQQNYPEIDPRELLEDPTEKNREQQR